MSSKRGEPAAAPIISPARGARQPVRRQPVPLPPAMRVVASTRAFLSRCACACADCNRYSRARRYHWRLVQLGLIVCLQGGELVRRAAPPALPARESRGSQKSLNVAGLSCCRRASRRCTGGGTCATTSTTSGSARARCRRTTPCFSATQRCAADSRRRACIVFRLDQRMPAHTAFCTLSRAGDDPDTGSSDSGPPW